MIENFQNNDDVNLTAEDYQEFHDDVRDDGYYSIRGYSLAVGGMLLIIGGVLLFRLNMLGVKLSLAGAMIGLIGGFSSSWMMAQTSAELFPKEAAMVFKIWSYLCGVCMTVCLAMAALPILNSSARMALNEKVTLVNEEE
jgi:membrane-bound ClpP family serine protease